jgi:type VI secretion system protein ImpC
MSNRATLELTLGSPSKGRRKSPGQPFRILFLTDLSGVEGDTPTFKPLKISYETFETVMASLAPSVTVEINAPLTISETITLSRIDDFHPDSLLRSLGAFRTLRILGDRLGDPNTRDEALAQLGELIGTGVPTAPRDLPLAVAEPGGEDETDMMERLLGTTAGASRKSRAQEKVATFIEGVIGDAQIEKPSVTADVGRQQIDELMTETMRAVLMSEPLRTLERAWRGVEWLMQRLDDEAVELYAVDLSRARLSGHLAENAEQLDRSALHGLFNEAPSGHPWDLFVGDYSFALDADDLLLLTMLGAIASQAGAPLLAHGDLSLCGCSSLGQLDTPWDWQLPEDELGAFWSEVRAHPAMQWVGLATPRLVLRQPYGPATDPVDAFDFSELPARPEPARFLWGNPALGCAYLLGRAHANELDFSGTGDLEVEDLPAVLYDDGTGQALQPPVEALIGERAMTQLLSGGLIPMLGRRDGNSVRCADLTAVSSKLTRFIG